MNVVPASFASNSPFETRDNLAGFIAAASNITRVSFGLQIIHCVRERLCIHTHMLVDRPLAPVLLDSFQVQPDNID